MSGLCGVVRFDHEPIPPDTLKRMTQAAPHRGPATTHTHHHAHLAHHTHHPHDPPQPLTHHHLTLIASARIDNHDDLLPHLQPHLTTPHPTDAQLILAAHHHWGHDAPHHLIGDYAYALYDHHHHTLLAARDPMGMRPLYYHHTPHRTAIASEINQLLQLPDVSAEPSEAQIARYLIGEFGPADETFYRGVRSLPAAHALIVDADGVRVRRFWQVDPERRERYPREEDYAERFRELFLRSVHDRLRPPGTHGLMLSGGVDSGSIASALGWLSERDQRVGPLHAYSWAFDTLRECDERHLSDHVVRRYGFRARDVDAERVGPLRTYPRHGPHRDEPFIGAFQSVLETGLEMARDDGVTHLWSGDRGDLINGAWTLDYRVLLRSGRLRELVFELREQASIPGESWLGVLARDVVGPTVGSVARRLRPRERTPQGAHRDPRRPPWLSGELLQRTGVDPGSRHDATPPERLQGLARRTRYELVFVPLHMRGMVWSERTNAAHGIGFVDPWSDRRLAEYVISIPQQVLNRPREVGKRLVREAMHGIMPEALRENAAKIVPTPLYLRALRSDAASVVRTLLTDMQAERHGYVDGPAIRAHYDEFAAGGRDHPAFWWALTLEMWLQRYWS
jgi:asparagine synthase (glutamine-hydrolysing)